MLHKKPKRSFSVFKSVKIVIFLEAACFVGSYAFWSYMNKSQDCRYFMYQHFPSILSGYYYLYEKTYKDNKLRLLDLSLWESQQNES